MKNNNKGFSLVELIVVIAIMAILAAVAVVGFSMYIPKAQQASDKQMVGDIEYALELHAQSTPNDVTAGYVILTPTGAQATEGFVTDVLIATYGEDWASELKLAYGEWTDDGLLAVVAEMDADALENVANSTFLTTATPDGMMNTVTNLTGIVGDVIQGSDASAIDERLATLFGDDNTLVTTMQGLNLTPGTEEYSTALSNLLVGQFAGMMAESSDSPMTYLCATYANVYAYSVNNPDDEDAKEALASMDDYLQNLSYDVLSGWEDAEDVDTALEDLDGYAEYQAYVSANGDESNRDAAAFVEMMDAVSAVSGTYTDKDSLTNKQLYASDSVAAQINNYANAVKVAASGIDLSALADVPEGSIVIFITADGVVSAIPDTQA